MTKTVIREIIIALLVCLAILLLLCVALYNFIPSNKVIPEKVQYTPTKEIQDQLNSTVEDSSEEIIMTYEVTANDLDNFEKKNQYNPGKANPFAAYSPSTGESGTENGTSGDTSSNGTTSSNNNSGGSLFENGSSK